MDCIFCKIASGADKSSFVYEDDLVAAFPDINPKTPVHILVVPKVHIATLDDLDSDELAAALLKAVRTVAKARGVEGGYRVITNVGKGGGQVVDHLHMHVLGGKKLSPELGL